MKEATTKSRRITTITKTVFVSCVFVTFVSSWFLIDVFAQAEIAPVREFKEFRGTWVIDEGAGRGHISGLPVASTLTIATTMTELTLTTDRGQDTYRLDGEDMSLGDTSTRVTLVAGALAVTTRRTRHQRGYAFTNIITDAYSVNGDVLTVERQLAVAVQADPDNAGVQSPGHLVELSDPKNNRQTIVYRRKP
jgi:hypothetical protein